MRLMDVEMDEYYSNLLGSSNGTTIEEPSIDWAKVAVRLFICIAGILGNLLVIFVIVILQEYKKAVTHWYVLQLAIADSVFLLTLPFKIDEDINDEWRFSSGMCKGKETILFLNYYASILFLMVLLIMSIDRYIAVCHGFSDFLQKFRSHTAAYIITIATWIIALIICAPIMLYSDKRGFSPSCKCQYEFPKQEQTREELCLFEGFTDIASCPIPEKAELPACQSLVNFEDLFNGNGMNPTSGNNSGTISGYEDYFYNNPGLADYFSNYGGTDLSDYGNVGNAENVVPSGDLSPGNGLNISEVANNSTNSTIAPSNTAGIVVDFSNFGYDLPNYEIGFDLSSFNSAVPANTANDSTVSSNKTIYNVTLSLISVYYYGNASTTSQEISAAIYTRCVRKSISTVSRQDFNHGPIRVNQVSLLLHHRTNTTLQTEVKNQSIPVPNKNNAIGDFDISGSLPPECHYWDKGLAWRSYLIFNFVIMFLVPLFVMAFCYTMIVLKLQETKLNTRSESVGETTASMATSSEHQPMSGKKTKRKKSAAQSRSNAERNRVTIMCAMLVILFLVCWLPFHAIHLSKIIGMNVKHSHEKWCTLLPTIASLIAFMNSALNPYLYNFLGTKFGKRLKKAAISVQSSIRRKSHQSESGRVQYHHKKKSSDVTSSQGATVMTKIYKGKGGRNSTAGYSTNNSEFESEKRNRNSIRDDTNFIQQNADVHIYNEQSLGSTTQNSHPPPYDNINDTQGFVNQM